MTKSETTKKNRRRAKKNRRKVKKNRRRRRKIEEGEEESQEKKKNRRRRKKKRKSLIITIIGSLPQTGDHPQKELFPDLHWASVFGRLSPTYKPLLSSNLELLPRDRFFDRGAGYKDRGMKLNVHNFVSLTAGVPRWLSRSSLSRIGTYIVCWSKRDGHSYDMPETMDHLVLWLEYSRELHMALKHKVFRKKFVDNKVVAHVKEVL
ncbi:hypothetical protein YC2023_076880 [Brassica napus]